MKTIFISGYAADTVDVGHILDMETLFLTKPFTPAQLLEKAGQLLRDTTRSEAKR